MYRGVFTVGIAVTRASLTLADALTDYSYVNARDGDPNGVWLARCLTGLGPSSTSSGANGAPGGFYFNGNMIPNSGEQELCSSDVIQVRPGGGVAGVTNIHRCKAFSTAAEGVYTCTMRNSSMMDQSVRFGIYFNGRSESLDSYIPILDHLFFSLHSCSSDRYSNIICYKNCCWFFPDTILYLTRFSPRHIHMEEG